MTFRAPVRDLAFALEAIAGIDDVAATGAFPDYDADLMSAVLDAAGQFSEQVLAPLNRVGDQKGSLYANAVQGRQHLFRKLSGGVQHRAHQVGVIVGKGAGAGDVVDSGDGLEREGQITDGGAEGHGAFLKRCVFFRF